MILTCSANPYKYDEQIATIVRLAVQQIFAGRSLAHDGRHVEESCFYFVWLYTVL